MNALQCQKCGQNLAMAESQCSACGTAVPVAQRLAVLLPRAEAFAEQESFAEAARALEPALALALEPAEAKKLWRKKGVWMRKAAVDQPELLDGAEAALGESLRLDDADDLSHQVWIDLLVQRGFGEKARSWYQQRLQLNPDDAMAKRQMLVLKLASDFKAQPRPQSQLDLGQEPDNIFWRMVVPTPGKAYAMGASGLVSLGIALYAAISPAGPPPAAAAPVDPDLASAMAANPAQLMSGLMDPWTNLVAAALCGAYVYWAYTRRKRRPTRG